MRTTDIERTSRPRPNVAARAAVLALVALTTAACGGAGSSATVPGDTAAAHPSSPPPTSETPAATEPAWRSSDALSPHPLGETDAPMGYYEYLPPGYGDGEPRPLLVALHGGGATGDGSVAELAKVFDGNPPDLIHQDAWPADRPFVVLAPQHPGPPEGGPPAEYAEAYGACDGQDFPASCWLATQHRLGHPPDGSPCHTPQEVHDFLEYALANYDVDPQRVYLTGLSCGAFSAYEYVAQYGASQIAAMVPISGNARPAWETVGCDLGVVPIWAFHGMLDDISRPADEIEPVNDLIACPQPLRQEVKLTTYPDADHDAWSRTYDLSAGNDIYGWLLHFTKP